MKDEFKRQAIKFILSSVVFLRRKFLTQKNRVNFLIVMIFVFFIFLVHCYQILIYLPAKSEILNIQSEAAKLQVMLENLEKLKSRHKNLKEFAAKSDKSLSNLQKNLPEISQPENFTESLYLLAAESNVEVTSVISDEPIEEKLKKKFKRKIFSQAVNVRAEGDYVALLNFIREISDGERVAKFTTISLEKSDDKPLTCNMKILIYTWARK